MVIPIYTFTCKEGHSFDKIARMGILSCLCDECGKVADKESVYRLSISNNMDNPHPQADEANFLGKRDLKRDHDMDMGRAVDAIRKSMVEDKQGMKSLDTRKIAEITA